MEHEQTRAHEPAEENAAALETALPEPELVLPALAAALAAAPQERLDRHLGQGVVFALGPGRQTRLELFPDVVRVSRADAELSIARAPARVDAEGVVFEAADGFALAVDARGGVRLHLPPAPAAFLDDAARPQMDASTSPSSPPAPTETKAKPKSERYVGRLGEVRTHRTTQGKLVAEVELAVADPDRPGASLLVKLAAFDAMAERLRDTYQPGQEVTAVGIPHELRRRSRDGREWSERQLYLVQPPKPRA